MQLYTAEYGKAQNSTPLVILHGLFGQSDNWKTVARALGQDYHVLVPDLRNHGRSPHTTEHHYRIMAEDLRLWVEERGLQSPAFVGHSMGGKAAMFLATAYPDYVERLMVVDMAPKPYPVHHDYIIEGMKRVPLHQIRSRQDADNHLATHINDQGIRQFLLKNLARDEDGGFFWRVNLEGVANNIEKIGEGLPDSARFLGPTLFLRGEKSHYVKDKDQELIHHFFPNGRLETMPGAGHWIHAQKPQEFMQTLKNFMSE